MPYPTRYYKTSIQLHWITALIMVAVYASLELGELYPKGSDIREAFKAWHFMLGLIVLILTAFRLYMRAKHRTPVITPRPGPIAVLTAHVVHATLYVMMIGLPLLGWIILSAAGKPVPFFGLELPALVNENEVYAKSVKSLHETIGTACYYLIGLHALAALFHHYFLKDNTLLRMLKK